MSEPFRIIVKDSIFEAYFAYEADRNTKAVELVNRGLRVTPFYTHNPDFEKAPYGVRWYEPKKGNPHGW